MDVYMYVRFTPWSQWHRMPRGEHGGRVIAKTSGVRVDARKAGRASELRARVAWAIPPSE